jgi:hypothetical protein
MLITRASDCTIKRFMQAWFDNVREDIDFEAIHLEYVDLSGIGKTRQLELEARVHWINNRIERVKMLVYAERVAIIELSLPFSAGIEDLRSLGHKIYWDGDSKLFMELLTRIETKEKKYFGQLEIAQSELNLFIHEQNKGEAHTTIQSRQMFISNIIMLRKSGHYIIENETTVETLALIIKSHNEDIERQNNKNVK